MVGRNYMNNNVIYAKSWNTRENKGYSNRLSKYLRNCLCMSDCPLAWAKEVSILLEGLDKKYGIKRSVDKRYHRGFGSTFHNLFLFYIKIENALYNFIKKPQISLDQVKEKYGELRVYYSASEEVSEIIDELIHETEVKLAIKGAYYPKESLWNYCIIKPLGDREVIQGREIMGKDGDVLKDAEIKEYHLRKYLRKYGYNKLEVKE